MERKFYEDGSTRYMRLICPKENQNEYERKMLLLNRPERFLPMHIIHDGAGEYIDYDISGLTAITSCSEEEIQSYLFGILFAMSKVADALTDYLLSPESVLLNPEMIFLRKETGRVFFCYLPGYEKSLSESLGFLMEYFIKRTNPTKEEDVLLIYGLYQKSREDNCTLKTFYNYWKDMSKPAPFPETSFEIPMDEISEEREEPAETEPEERETEDGNDRANRKEQDKEDRRTRVIRAERIKKTSNFTFSKTKIIHAAEVIVAVVFFILAIRFLFF